MKSYKLNSISFLAVFFSLFCLSDYALGFFFSNPPCPSVEDIKKATFNPGNYNDSFEKGKVTVYPSSPLLVGGRYWTVDLPVATSANSYGDVKKMLESIYSVTTTEAQKDQYGYYCVYKKSLVPNYYVAVLSNK